MEKPVHIINAPSNLGLRPLRPGHIPGAWAAPDALAKAGLSEAVKPAHSKNFYRPHYEPGPQEGTSLRNGFTLREFNLQLADEVERVNSGGGFALVVGGDCSILLGALAGVSRNKPLSLIHIDGHSDFRHPGNYDVAAGPAAPAGMDLAFATGRGEMLLTAWPGAPTPLIPDERVVQIGERELRDDDFAWPDVMETAITLLDIFTIKKIGMPAVLERAFDVIDRHEGHDFWVHVDVDALDQNVMPAVDCPGSPGLSPEDLSTLLHGLVHDPRCAGMTLAIYDPDLDPDRRYAELIVGIMAEAFRH